MKNKIEIQLIGPDYQKIEILNNTFILISVGKIDTLLVRKVILSNLFNDHKMIDQLSKLIGEFSFIRINRKDEKPTNIFAFRSITSNFELFYANIDAGLILSNNFRNILSSTHLNQRIQSDEAIVDLFLFQRNYGDRTYIKSINRLGFGESIEYIVSDGVVKKEQIQRIEISNEYFSVKECTNKIEEQLGVSINQLEAENQINTLSGGVDSSLVQTYLSPKNKSISVAYDTPEFRNEIDYATNASALLQTNHEFIKIKETDYLPKFIDSVFALGQPSPDISNIVIAEELSKSRHQHFLTSMLADGIFGLPTIKELYELNEEKESNVKKGLDLPYNHRDGFASQRFCIARKNDINLIKNIFGEKLVNERIEERLDFTNKKIVFTAKPQSAFSAHSQYGSILDFFTNNILSIFRQIGSNYGKSFSSPFLDESIINASFQIKPEERYFSKQHGTKPVLKAILQRRLNKYEVNNSKLGDALPRTRFCENGPFIGFFESNPIPDFINDEYRKQLLAPNWDNSWIVLYSIFYSIWENNVLKNKNLSLIKDTEVLRWHF